MLGVHGLDCSCLRVDLGGKHGDLFGRSSLLGIELEHAAGEHDAETGAKLVAKGSVTLSLGGLTLQGAHLAGHFLEDVVDAGEILLGRLEAEFGEALLGLESCDPGGLFDDAAAVMWLGREGWPIAPVR